MLSKKEVNRLVALCKSNDRKAQHRIYDAYKDSMFSICNRYASSSAQAEDMLVEGFLRAFSNISSYNFSASFYSWLKVVFVHNCINVCKRESKAQTEELTCDIADMERDTDLPERFSGEDLLHSLQTLPERQRLIFNLYVMEDYKYTEIAELLETSVDVVKTTVYRVRMKLKDFLLELERQRRK